MKRKLRIVKFVVALSTGAYVLQAGTCISAGFNTLLASFPTGTVLTDLGLPGVCGTPNFVIVDENGNVQGDVMNTEDDLVFFCPVDVIVQQMGDGGDDGGDGG